jgi:N-sulfoglucosamine sulfohydrolase
VAGVTPNLDKLASEGTVFTHCHMSIAVCQPSRQAMMTGRHPHCNGGLGFQPISEDVPTLQEHLRAAGYFNGIIGKNSHLAPKSKFCWDYDFDIHVKEHTWGRDPAKYYKYSKQFFDSAKTAGKPFFLMANSHDPHRPFAGSEAELKMFGEETQAPRKFSPEEAEIPGFLPDLPDIRQELAEYYTSVRRCDETVGEILRALDDAGHRDNTIVVFVSDNGMAFPFAKTNCYLNSTKSPCIIRWPNHAKANARDGAHMISGIDFMPTLLDALNLPAPDGMNGKSFLKALLGENQAGFEQVFTTFNSTAAGKPFPMRALQDKTHGYIFNAWADGSTRFFNESKSGLTYRAMVNAGEHDGDIRRRTEFFDFRTAEEFYNFETDPDALDNLIDSPEHSGLIAQFRERLKNEMASTNDPILEKFEKSI